MTACRRTTGDLHTGLLGLLISCSAAAVLAGDPPDFEREIAPVLIERCLGCHNSSEAKGGLVLATRQGAIKGGDSGPALSPGDPAESYLLERILNFEMPPEEEAPLPPQERSRLEAWVRAGAPWPEGRTLSLYEKTTGKRAGRDWWSFRKVDRPAVPAVRSGRVANPVDAFIHARLEERGMEMAPTLERRKLARRVYFDLLGLPPTPEEVRTFLDDTSEGAYERLLDRLLASPQYGERWGRYWLDLVRFAETDGYERDATKPFAWRYRDWVIRSLNADKPYDTFVAEQLAGDEVSHRSEETVIATGMLRLGTWNDEPNDPFEYKYERLEDMVHVTSTAFLALTVKCARCHDHKFDPIPQTDYYRMASVFWAGFIEPRARELMGGPGKDELGFDVLGWTDRGREVPAFHLLKKGDPHRPGERVEPGSLTLAPALDRPLAPPPDEAKTTGRRLQLAAWITHPDNPLTARVLVNRLWQHHFGAGLVRTPDNFGFTGSPPTHPELLDWLASELMAGGWRIKRMHRLLMMSEAYRQDSIHPRHAEYDRTDAANRLWWRANQRRLEAETLRDALLAVSGELNPTTGGPSFFPLMTSEALEGLSRKGAEWGESPQAERNRRSVYLFTKRSRLLPLMTAFDFPDTAGPCGQRDVTTVPTQALALLNTHVVHGMSTRFALRVAKQAGPDRERQVRLMWNLAFGRDPAPEEIADSLEHLRLQKEHFLNSPAGGLAEVSEADSDDRDDDRDAEQLLHPEQLALASLCHVVLNANQFIYVD